MAKTTKTKTTKKKTKASCPTDDLIKSLCGDLTPMQAVGCQVRRSFPWILFSGLYAAIVIHYAGMRPDLSEALHSGVFLFELVLVGVTALFAAFSSISMTVPDMQGRKWLKPVSFTLMGVFFLWAFTQWIAGGMSLPHFHWGHCINQGAILGLIPIAMLLYMTKRGSTTTPVLINPVKMRCNQDAAKLKAGFLSTKSNLHARQNLLWGGYHPKIPCIRCA